MAAEDVADDAFYRDVLAQESVEAMRHRRYIERQSEPWSLLMVSLAGVAMGFGASRVSASNSPKKEEEMSTGTANFSLGGASALSSA